MIMLRCRLRNKYNMANKKSQVEAKKKPAFTHWGEKVLSEPTKLLTPAYMKSVEFKNIVRGMFEAINGIGVGLAANQIGLPYRFAVVVIKPTENRPGIPSVPPTVLINPKILSRSKDLQYGWEACLSCEGTWFFTPRSKWIKVSYIDGNYKKITEKVEGFPAVVFQHEIDHLDGNICGERVLVVKGKVAKGAIITLDQYKKDPRRIPEGARHLVKAQKKK